MFQDINIINTRNNFIRPYKNKFSKLIVIISGASDLNARIRNIATWRTTINSNGH